MLGSLRRNAQSWIIKGVLWLVVAAFVGTIFLVWGRGGNVAKNDAAVIVNKRVISISQFYEEVQNLENVYRQVYGKLYDNKQIDKSILKREALNNLIDRELLREAAENLNIHVTDREVKQGIASTPAFMVNNSFSKERYLQILQTNSITPQAYETQMKVDLQLRKLQSFINSSSFISDKEVKDRYLSMKREVKVSFLALDPASFSVPPPKSKEIEDYYLKNRERFRSPAMAQVEYAEFSSQAFMKGISLSDEEIKTYFDANEDRYMGPEKRRAYVIHFPFGGKSSREGQRKKAGKIREEIKSGKYTFIDAAKRYSKGKTLSSQYKGDWFEKKDLPGNLGETLFSLPVDEISPPLETTKGVKLYKVAEIKRRDPLPLAKVKERVMKDLSLEKARDKAIIKAYESRGKIVKGAEYEKVIPSYGLTIRKTGLNSPGEAAPPAKGLLSAAFLLPVGETGEVKKLGDSYYVFKVLAKKNPSIRSLDKVRGEIKNILTKKRKWDAANTYGKKLISRYNGKKGNLFSLAGKQGKRGTTPLFSPISSKGIPGIGYSRELAREVLSLGTLKPLSDRPVTFEGKIYILEFEGEKKVKMELFDKEKIDIRNALLEQKRQEAFKSFIKEQRSRARIEISKDLKI
jgi:peptidyl-prolyl cis-trans isomerase D